MSARVWILGAADPEMDAIEALLRECGQRVVYAVDERGERVRPAAMYRASLASPVTADVIYEVECMVTDRSAPVTGQRIMIDHHRPCDPGYGRPPEEFLPASSIGQVIAALAELGVLPKSWGKSCWNSVPGTIQLYPEPYDRHTWCVVEEGTSTHASVDRIIPHELVLVAAADHCLGAAYRGECPGVDPDALMHWRAESRAKFQGRSADEVLADVVAAQRVLMVAPSLDLSQGAPCCGAHLAGDYADPECCSTRAGAHVRDMRRSVDAPPVRELPEAATRLGVGYIAGSIVDPDGRRKFTCSGTSEQVRAFLDVWAPREGLVDLYGDPARGFAGGYEQRKGQ